MRHFLMLFCSVGLLLSACNSAQKKEIEALDKETMAIHDEAMKEMADMNRTSRAIKTFLTTATMTPEQSAVFSEALINMEKAEADMMAWMAQYKSPENKPAEEALAYLKDQKAKISKNRDDIHAALEAGKKLLPK
ncbi:MAG: hypothetical protein IT262_19295 [Saprospiraceae bacterium]|jgi:spore coat protein CotF|nr:hypothetical protein [Saprospiraceae bacterium]